MRHDGPLLLECRVQLHDRHYEKQNYQSDERERDGDRAAPALPVSVSRI
jgi:hypothetical protein